MTVLVIVVALTLGISAMCSLFEATLFSTRTATLEAARVEGAHRTSAERFLRMKTNLASPTSAILILNTVANTAGAAVAGMLAADVVGHWFIPTFSAGLTIAILFISEVLPKTYGAVQWRRLWPAVVWPLAAIETVLRPLVYVTQKFAHLVIPRRPIAGDAEEEILAMIRLSGRAGEMTPSEQEMLTTVFAFDEITAAEVMILAAEVETLDPTWSLEQCFAHIRDVRHTRYPLTTNGLTDTPGLIHIKDLVGLDDDDEIDLVSVARPLGTVLGSTPIPRLLREMQRSRRHMSLVSDADGAIIGIVTLEDILAQIVGPVEEAVEPELIFEGAGRYAVAGSIPVVELNRQLGLDIDHPSDVDTLSSLMVSRLGRLLKLGDRVDLDGLTAEVLDVVGTQATEIRLTLAARDEEE